MVTNVLCNGSSTGAIDLTVSGGVEPFTYVWANLAGSPDPEDRTNLPAGTYTVTVTGSDGCTASVSATVTQPAALVLTRTIGNATCTNANGSIDLTVTGGTSPYSYNWSNIPGTSDPEDQSNLSPGTYTVTVTDANGCVGTSSATVGNSSSLSLSRVITNVLCRGEATGAIDLTVNNGTGPYTYNWSNIPGNNDPEDLTGLTSGTYTVTVTDALGCSGTSSATITQPSSALDVEIDDVDNATCGNSNGAIDIDVSGGTGSRTYLWSSGQTSQDLSNIPAGTYTVTVTDANGCTATASANVSNSNGPSISKSITNVLCNGASTGAIDISVSGGGGTSYTYMWSNGATTQDLTGLPAGTYTVTVTSNVGCSTVNVSTVTQPSALALSIVEETGTCGSSGNLLNLSVSGGDTPYDYLWSSGQTTQDISNVPAGTYTVTVTDDSNCTATASITAQGSSQGQCPPAGFPTPGNTCAEAPLLCQSLDGYCTTINNNNIPQTFPGCNSPWELNNDEWFAFYAGSTTISIQITPCNCNGSGTTGMQGGIYSNCGSPSWVSMALQCSCTEDPFTLQSSNFVVGQIYYFVLDGCDGDVCDYSIEILSGSMGTCCNMALSTSATDVLCNGAATGSINLTVTGGTAPFTYSWTGGSTSEDPSGLPAGTYTVTVTDANGCSETATATIAQPSVLSLTIDQISATCLNLSNGSIDLNVSGGTPSYTYAWSNGATVQDPGGLNAGAYTVTVTDQNGCAQTTSATVATSSCSGGGPCDATRWTQGGAWVGGCPNAAGLIDDGASANGGIVRCGNSADTQSNIHPNSCYDPNAFTATLGGTCIDPNDGSPTSITLPLPCQQVLWFNFDVRAFAGGYDFQVVGGMDDIAWILYYSTDQTNCLGTYTPGLSGNCNSLAYYTCGTNFTGWANQQFTAPIFDKTTNVYLLVWDQGFSQGNTTDDDFSVTFKAQSGCGETQDCALFSNGIPEISCNPDGSYTVTQELYGLNTTVSVSAPNATTIATSPDPLVFTNLGENPAVTSGSVSAIFPPGTDYEITLTPAGSGENCNPIIIQGTAPDCCMVLADAGPDKNICFGTSTTIGGAPAGSGTGTLSYEWSPADGLSSTTISNPQANPANSTVYTLTVTSALGCSATSSMTVTVNPALILSSSGTNVLCSSDGYGSIDLTVTGGTPGYTYAWSNLFTGEDPSGLAVGTYTVTVTDGNNCTATHEQTIAAQDQTPPVITCPPTATVDCPTIPTPGVTGTATASDNFDPNPAITYADGPPVTGACPEAYSFVRTWTATDVCELTSACLQTINVVDVTPPVFDAPPASVTVECIDDLPGMVSLDWTDACEGFGSVTGNDVSDNASCPETITRTWTYTDACGNVGSTFQLIVVQDISVPVISTAANSGDLGCNPTVVAPTFTGLDNCEGTFIPMVTTTGPSNTGCAYTQTWLANYTDGCNNAAIEQSITYTWTQDTEPPVISTTASSGDLGCNPTVVAPTFTGTDNCEGAFLPTVTTTGPSNTGCAYTQTWLANYTDGCGNPADEVSITYTWTQDSEAPVISTTANSGDLGCNPTVVAPTFTGLTTAKGPSSQR
ncbi:MAG: SprB repeat-containing protein [Lewinellaceae bacterium]|nr:SprB repeat-containing protein [Lewinellaceae bacterium]